MKSKYFLLILLLVYLSVLFYFAVTNHPERIESLLPQDKLLHGIEFFILGLLVLKTFTAFKLPHAEGLFLIVCMVIGLISEGVQVFVPSRTVSLYDFYADLFGIMSSWIVYKVVLWKL